MNIQITDVGATTIESLPCGSVFKFIGDTQASREEVLIKTKDQDIATDGATVKYLCVSLRNGQTFYVKETAKVIDARVANLTLEF